VDVLCLAIARLWKAKLNVIVAVGYLRKMGAIKMSEFLEYGGMAEMAKELWKEVTTFFSIDYDILYAALKDAYDQGVYDTREAIKKGKDNE
jgi:hypothetical protein